METIKKSPRELLLLLKDLNEIKKCDKCHNGNGHDDDSICCIYHSFFVVNVHLSGHPCKWRSRLNAIQKIINKLKVFGFNHKSKKIEKKAVKINTNINAKWQNMRIIICGDFNTPKTGNVDKLLIDKCININNYNVTRNIYEDAVKHEENKENRKKITRNKKMKTKTKTTVVHKKVIRFCMIQKLLVQLLVNKEQN